MYPDLMDALLPLQCVPVEIAGLNRLLRRVITDSIRCDPEWRKGEYEKQPTRGLTGAQYGMDANDHLYQFEASRDYNSSPTLDTIAARVIAINTADDSVNPPELGVMERELLRVRRGKYVLIPRSGETAGHRSYLSGKLFKQYVTDLLSAPYCRSMAASHFKYGHWHRRLETQSGLRTRRV